MAGLFDRGSRNSCLPANSGNKCLRRSNCPRPGRPPSEGGRQRPAGPAPGCGGSRTADRQRSRSVLRRTRIRRSYPRSGQAARRYSAAALSILPDQAQPDRSGLQGSLSQALRDRLVQPVVRPHQDLERPAGGLLRTIRSGHLPLRIDSHLHVRRIDGRGFEQILYRHGRGKDPEGDLFGGPPLLRPADRRSDPDQRSRTRAHLGAARGLFYYAVRKYIYAARVNEDFAAVVRRAVAAMLEGTRLRTAAGR